MKRAHIEEVKRINHKKMELSRLNDKLVQENLELAEANLQLK